MTESVKESGANTLAVFTDTYAFGSESIKKSDVATITFLDSLDEMPEDAWDVSQDSDGSVMAWVEKGSGFYDLYIAGEGGVNANENSAGLFLNFVY